jgi:cobalt-zinc-cadmium resistance protein CzcA
MAPWLVSFPISATTGLAEGSPSLKIQHGVCGISINESLHGNESIQTVLKQFPEVDKVVCRTGRPEVAVDPLAIDQSDVYVILKPVSEWPSKRSKEELVTEMKEALELEAPGAAYSFMQPIEMRMRELMEAGVRSDIAVKLYGEDLNLLREKAQQIVKVVEARGAADVRAERVAGLPYLQIRVRRNAIARHGLDAQEFSFVRR